MLLEIILLVVSFVAAIVSVAFIIGITVSHISDKVELKIKEENDYKDIEISRSVVNECWQETKPHLVWAIVVFIISSLTLISCLVIFTKKETIGVYNELEYDVEGIVSTYLDSNNNVKYKTDNSGITYIKIEKYVNVDNKYEITVYNYIKPKDFYDNKFNIFKKE